MTAARLLDQAWPPHMTVLVLAPHPDDFDAIGVTLHHLHAQQHTLHLAVLTGGANGVDGSGSGSVDDKTAQREDEQRDSCRFFGLPAARCHFLRLWEDPLAAAADDARLRALILGLRPDLVFMPHGNDSNATHRRTCQSFCAIAADERLTLQACLNQDAKTLGMRSDLYMGFDADVADWKARLLRHHRSQQQRNLRTRKIGFDARVLQLNRDAATALELNEAYAEVFELMPFIDGAVQAHSG
jgi:LmbE family N-acetylglucosaminyl deacetylase